MDEVAVAEIELEGAERAWNAPLSRSEWRHVEFSVEDHFDARSPRPPLAEAVHPADLLVAYLQPGAVAELVALAAFQHDNLQITGLGNLVVVPVRWDPDGIALLGQHTMLAARRREMVAPAIQHHCLVAADGCGRREHSIRSCDQPETTLLDRDDDAHVVAIRPDIGAGLRCGLLRSRGQQHQEHERESLKSAALRHVGTN